jgi:hypothetical protein
MTEPALSNAPLAGVRNGAAQCLAAATIVAALAAAAVWAGGLADETRRALRFGFGGLERTPGEAASIALYNARVAGGTLLCAIVAPHVSLRARRAIFLLLCTVLACCASAVGVAIGAYGSRLIRAVAVHGPVEFSAFALAGGAYMQACKQGLSRRELAAITAGTGLLLIVAAVLETYVSNGGTR